MCSIHQQPMIYSSIDRLYHLRIYSYVLSLCRMLSTRSPLSSSSYSRSSLRRLSGRHLLRSCLFLFSFASSGAQCHHCQHLCFISASVHVRPPGFSRGLRPPDAQHLSQLGSLRALLGQAQVIYRMYRTFVIDQRLTSNSYELDVLSANLCECDIDLLVSTVNWLYY